MMGTIIFHSSIKILLSYLIKASTSKAACPCVCPSVRNSIAKRAKPNAGPRGPLNSSVVIKEDLTLGKV